ncbi:MAG: hypothetical protein WCT08_04445 [Patescibacteria group bacterium]|jgi:hypothetical protein
MLRKSQLSKRIIILIIVGYYILGLVLFLTIGKDSQADFTMQQRFEELPGSFPELAISGFFQYLILPLLWPALLISKLIILL